MDTSSWELILKLRELLNEMESSVRLSTSRAHKVLNDFESKLVRSSSQEVSAEEDWQFTELKASEE